VNDLLFACSYIHASKPASHRSPTNARRCENATERMMEYAATLEPKCHPTAVKKLNAGPPPVQFTPRQNPCPPGFDPLDLSSELPPVPEYKPYKSPLQGTPAFDELHKLFSERIAYIDGAMGTMIQRYKLEVREGLFVRECSRPLFCLHLKSEMFIRLNT